MLVSELDLRFGCSRLPACLPDEETLFCKKLKLQGDSGTMLVNTVANNGTNYTNDDYWHAVQARELQCN